MADQNDNLPQIVGRLPPAMRLCLGCKQHAFPGSDLCPHCGADMAALERERDEAMALALDALERLKKHFGVTDAPAEATGA